jgi:UDP-hydrolysing UDP-N-acetyl-D-glucosamine 2-epimerase
MGLELINMSNVLEKICPDIVIVLGDRYEILCAVMACTIFKIPIAHLCGGNITKGAYDDKIRHAITKLSHIHFVTDDESEKVVRQMGETDIHICGNPGLEGLDTFEPVKLDYKFGKKNLLLVYHPETVDVNNIVIAIKIKNQLLKLNTSIWNIFVIRSNADNDNNEITNIFKELKAQFILSLERVEYLSLMKRCDVLVGNSSSFIFEAPILQIPVILIGNRQLGRQYATNIIVGNENDLYENINQASLLSGPYEIYYKPFNTRNIVKNNLDCFLKKLERPE